MEKVSALNGNDPLGKGHWTMEGAYTIPNFPNPFRSTFCPQGYEFVSAVCNARVALMSVRGWWRRRSLDGHRQANPLSGLFFLLKSLFYSRAVFEMCICLEYIWSCVRVCHRSHSLVNHHWTVVTQRMNWKHVWLQFGGKHLAKGCDWFRDHPLVKQRFAGQITLKHFAVLSSSSRYVLATGDHLFIPACQPDTEKACSQQHSVM